MAVLTYLLYQRSSTLMKKYVSQLNLQHVTEISKMFAVYEVAKNTLPQIG